MGIDRGINEKIIRSMSEQKGEPAWMLELRLTALEHFEKTPLPTWGANLNKLKLDDLQYYLRPTKKKPKHHGTKYQKRSRRPLTSSGCPKTNRPFLPV